MKRSTKGKRILQAYSGDPPPFELPHGSSITKLTQVHGLSQKGRIRLKVLDCAQPPPCGITCERLRSLLSVEEKIQPQKPPEPGRINREAQKDPEAPMDLRACGTDS